MSNTHTPGPWAYRMDSRNIGGPCDNSGRYVTIGSISESLFISDEEHEANTRLIAAAPDLLAALEGLLRDNYLADPINNERMREARAAITKARGQS